MATKARARNKAAEWSEIENMVFEEILAAIGDAAESGEGELAEIQPPESVLEAAATAAAQVIVSFEHGYRMG